MRYFSVKANETLIWNLMLTPLETPAKIEHVQGTKTTWTTSLCYNAIDPQFLKPLTLM